MEEARIGYYCDNLLLLSYMEAQVDPRDSVTAV